MITQESKLERRRANARDGAHCVYTMQKNICNKNLAINCYSFWLGAKKNTTPKLLKNIIDKTTIVLTDTNLVNIDLHEHR